MASNSKHFLVKQKYYECKHNYAASTMGYALDGCREFCPNGAPESLICAPCLCHRSFHRKMEVELPILSNTHHRHGTSLVIVVPPTPTSQQRSRIHPHQKYDENNNVAATSPPQGAETTEMGGGEIEVVEQMSIKRKRINSEQKERVKAFAEKIGWRRWTKYNKEVKTFCAEIGITPYFLKNWIDNNRRRFGPKKTI
ncbi:zinc-finger homeodomain protein 14-like [Nicotiana tabacum]|uniref:Zinc-finger homeodomain protein 14-like n=2 Tax=Nicotiana TaxID=4085 RepID=A0A1S3YKY7_TOBAC|nr:PREDICTED: zinc-finger homeodomain protein 5-like [Nicotiana sylvestris]XP_016452911.1 PREDICTED: zinc-finger homeodomain protein 5-like [Nicotiana tabacum]